jgi:hypothetical protein
MTHHPGPVDPTFLRRLPGRRPWTTALLLLAAVLGGPVALADPGPFALPASGCPMAHCDGRMSDQVGQQSPTVAVAVRVDRGSAGAVGGLGCVSNGRLAACTGASDPSLKSNLSVYDADGNLVWDDGGRLDATAWYSAAIISQGNQVIAADRRQLLRADPLSGTIVWQSLKPDDGTPISPVLIGTDSSMVLLATKADAGTGNPEVSVFDLQTGALLWHQAIVDGNTGVRYQTINTPAVKGNRAYVLAAAVGSPGDGRLVALDVCESDACGGRGRLQQRWTHPFEGPSSASPLLIGNRIFFDGLRGRSTGLLLAVDDLGNSPSQAWLRRYSSRFGFSASQDPRGGVWVSPWQSGTFLRVSEQTGETLQAIDVSAVLGLAPGYSPVTAVSVSSTAGGAVVLTFGVQNRSASSGTGPHVGAMDVSTQSTGLALWKYRVSSSAVRNAATGQYPIVTNAAGARRIVFRGTVSSTFFVGEP